MDTLTELILNGDLDSIKELVMEKPNDGYLLTACEEGKLDIVKYFIEELELDPTYDQNSPIRGAAQRGKFEVVKLLSTYKNVDPTDKYGKIIYNAAHNGKDQIVEFLLDNYTFSIYSILSGIVGALMNNQEETAMFILNRHKGYIQRMLEILNDESEVKRHLAIYFSRYTKYKPYILALFKRHMIESRDNLINTILDERS